MSKLQPQGHLEHRTAVYLTFQIFYELFCFYARHFCNKTMRFPALKTALKSAYPVENILLKVCLDVRVAFARKTQGPKECIEVRCKQTFTTWVYV